MAVAEITNNESIPENLQIIAETPDLSEDTLSPQQVADRAEAIYNEPLETLGMRSNLSGGYAGVLAAYVRKALETYLEMCLEL